MSITPCILVGAERSGTTLLRLMLDHHPQISFLQEFEYAVDYMPTEDTFPDLNTYYQQLKNNRIFQLSNFIIDQNLDYANLINSFLQQRVRKNGKSIIGATIHRHYNRILKLWPEAKFIHLIRDPRDVAPSCVQMGWAGNVWFGVDRWVESERLWNSVRGHISEDRQLDLRFEDLVHDPQEHLKSICLFIGVAYSGEMLNYWAHSTYDSVNPALANKWKHHAKPFQIRLIESKTAPLLEARGYKKSGLPPLRINHLLKYGLKFQNWVIKNTFSLGELGISLFCQVKLARLFRISSWETNLQSKIHTAININMK